MRLASPCVALSVALASSPLAQFQVWTVDDDGPADFADLQPAIDAAQDGDALLVQGGTYSAAVLSKRLTLLSESPTPVGVQTLDFGDYPLLTIENTTAAQPVLLLGIDLDAVATSVDDPVGYPVLARSLGGTLWVQDSELFGRGGIPVEGGTVVLRDVDITGSITSAAGLFGSSIFGPHDGDAVKMVTAELLAYGGSWEGARGASAGCRSGFSCGSATFAGGEGLRLEGFSTAYVVGVDAKGGGGEDTVCDPGTTWGDAGSGGDGIHTQSGSEVVAIESTFTAGVAGIAYTGCSDGVPGVDQTGPGTVTHSPDVRRSLTVTSLVREGETVDVAIDGQAGEVVLIGIATEPTKFEDPQIEGPLILGNLLSVIPLGALPSGQIGFSFTADDLPAGIEFFTFYAQPVFVAPTGERRAGDPTAFVILDSGV